MTASRTASLLTRSGAASRLVERVQGPRDERFDIALLLTKEGPQEALFDVAFALPFGPVSEMVVAELLAEQSHHALLGLFLDLADRAHHRAASFI